MTQYYHHLSHGVKYTIAVNNGRCSLMWNRGSESYAISEGQLYVANTAGKLIPLGVVEEIALDLPSVVLNSDVGSITLIPGQGVSPDILPITKH